ncbi:acyltransferase-domain-containing protein [Multifurca ochricompacta]|uniref:Acyltransferase-domain-containing protein n=1 Tax=Multifurca ochricompacta TaxID=376703 RepID=A0AAD4MCW8_9AGAM|nr:acyltransferase-domain-containing protein [Multifurca ochricompacta]
MNTKRLHLHTVEIHKRPPRSWGQYFNAISYSVVFILGCLMINISQFVFVFPLLFLPFPWANSLYNSGIRLSKGAFGTLLVLLCQWFAPTRIIITLEHDGPGAFSQGEIDSIAIRDSHGRVLGINLPQNSVLIANHQVYADWWYAWCLTYFMNTHRDVCIVLKKSLKWVPVLGWGMQFFNFIFLARSWASDRLYLVKQLALLGRRAQERDTPLTFILYPEGTLVSQDTRPISKKYADKLGINDMTHTLLPRSTGLHYSLRALSHCVPDLQLLDITMAYPGVPPMGYGQSYYTLRSIFFDRIPPPAVHMHIRRFDVAKGVPIGNLFPNSGTVPNGSPHGQTVGVDVPEDERQTFDIWLRNRWIEKDQLMQRLHDTGSFSSSLAKYPEINIPLQLRRNREVLDAFCFFIPAIIGYTWSHLRRLAP